MCWRGPLGTDGIAGEIGAPADKGGVFCRLLTGPPAAASGTLGADALTLGGKFPRFAKRSPDGRLGELRTLLKAL